MQKKIHFFFVVLDRNDGRKRFERKTFTGQKVNAVVDLNNSDFVREP